MEIKLRKNYLRLPYDSIANGALPPWITSFLQKSSAGKLSEVAIKSSSTKSYLSIVSFFVHWKSIFFLPNFKEFGVNSTYKYVSTARLKSKTFALQCLGQKSSKLSPNFFEFSSPILVVANFWSAAFIWLKTTMYVFDHSKFPNMMSPGIAVKTSGRLKPLGKGEFYLIISVSFTLVISFVHLFVLVLNIIVWLLSGGLNTCPKCGCVLLISLCIFLAGSE